MDASCMAHANCAELQQLPRTTPSPIISVHVNNINIPEYYVGPIPQHLKPLYDLFNIHYIHVVAPGGPPNDFYIYEPALSNVIKKLNLHS